MNIGHLNVDTRTRIITGTCDKHVQLWALDSKLHLTNIFSVELPSTVLHALCFQGVDILVLGMYDGDM